MKRLTTAVCLLLAGCGADPGELYLPDESVRIQQEYLSEGHGTPDQDALDRLAAMERAQRALVGASYVARIYSRGDFGGSKPREVPWAGGAEWEGRTVWEVDYAKPDTYRLAAVESTRRDVVGMRVLLGRTSARVRYPGLRGLIAVERDLQHADMLDFRGRPLSALTPAATVARLAGAASARLQGETRLDGATLDLIEIPRTPSFDREIARELLGIERGTGVLRLHRMFTGEGRKVYEQQILGFRPRTGTAVVELAL